MTSNSDISQFYDNFQVRLLRDYIYGNLRLNMAIEFVTSSIPRDATSVLDVGCGIGTTSAGYVERRSDIRVVGVDISPQNIATATKLASSNRVRFFETDMTTTPEGGPFHVVSIVDVYEHIPLESRGTFHRSVGAALAIDGIVVMTTPSRSHQEWLAKHEPEGLQIVDEIIDRAEIQAFADEIDAELIQFTHVDVWTAQQYCYSLLSRRKLEPVAVTGAASMRLLPLRTTRRIEAFYSRLWDSREVKERRKRVRDAIGVDVLRYGHQWIETVGPQSIAS